MIQIIGAIVLALAFIGEVPAQQKRVYIANDDHTDYMWSADENAFRQAFLDMLDYYLNLADQTTGKSSDFRSRFNADGSFWVRVFEKNRTAAEFERLIGKIRDGSISVPLTLLNLCYGGMPAEAVLRSMYYAGSLERRYGLQLKLALAQENQTLPFGVGTLWAGAGASYFWKGICGCASRVPDSWDRPHDMYWWTGLDGSRILTKWNSMIRHNYYDIGGYAEARDPSGVIDFALSDAVFRARHPYDVIGLFGYGGDNLETTTDLFVQTAEAKSNSKSRVIVSNTIDFFDDFSATYGGSLPSQSLSFGNEWDLLNASMAELSARVKRATEKLRAAEALAAFVSLRNALFMRGRENEREAAWVDLGMYYDHDWTADGPISRDQRAAWQRERAAGIESYVTTLLGDARTALGQMIAKGGSNPRYFVFNPLGWIRTGEADLPYSGTDEVHVIDTATGLEAPSQHVSVDGQNYLRVWAENIPSVGYKTFDVVPGVGTAFGDAPVAGGNVLENAFYRLQLGTNGALLSLIDKQRGGREMIRTSGGRTANDLGPGNGTIEVENAGPVSATLRVKSTGPLVHETAVTIYRNSTRIDIRNEIRQNFGDLRTWDFNVNLDLALLRHEEIGAVILARLVGGGGQYAAKAARYDWLTLNHFADLSAGGTGLTISSPDLSFLRRGSSTPTFLDTQSSQISILAGGQVDGSSLGILNQGGDAYFLQRFALETHGDYDAAEAMRFALEHQNPLETGEVTGGTQYPGASFSLFSVSSPGVFVWAVKPAEETAEGGIIVRLWNQAPDKTDFNIRFDGYNVLDARRTSLIETPLESAAFQTGLVSGTIPGFGWRAYHIKLNGAAVFSTIVVTSPNGGENFLKESIHNITWTTTGTVGNVKIEYSMNAGTAWTTIVDSTANDGTYSWNLPTTLSTKCLVRVSEAADGIPADQSDDAFSIVSGLPTISLSKTAFNFGSEENGIPTPGQTTVLSNRGDGTMAWMATPSVGWINVSPRGGIGDAVLTITIADTNDTVGNYTGTIPIVALGAANSPQIITVNLSVIKAGSDAVPFGDFATPADGSTVRSSVPVTGWVLDDVYVSSVKIYRGTDIADRVYIGDATFVRGARPDVETAYPSYPRNDYAGWGYMLLTNCLPGGGNGPIILSAYAVDSKGQEILLGSKAITGDNAKAVNPFGAIDTPTQGGAAAGASFVNFGWVLTPLPDSIAIDGSTIFVYVDSLPLGHPTYNQFRNDIASLFPGLFNSNGAVGYFYLDTTALSNGVHTIEWGVTDSSGDADGIGSRYFTVTNLSTASSAEEGLKAISGTTDFALIPENRQDPVYVKRGIRQGGAAESVYPDENGDIRIAIQPWERIAVSLDNTEISGGGEESLGPSNRLQFESNGGKGLGPCAAFQSISGQMRTIPIGSSFDSRKGIFFWKPGPGFAGEFTIVFVNKSGFGLIKKTVKITIAGDRPFVHSPIYRSDLLGEGELSPLLVSAAVTKPDVNVRRIG